MATNPNIFEDANHERRVLRLLDWIANAKTPAEAMAAATFGPSAHFLHDNDLVEFSDKGTPKAQMRLSAKGEQTLSYLAARHHGQVAA